MFKYKILFFLLIFTFPLASSQLEIGQFFSDLNGVDIIIPVANIFTPQYAFSHTNETIVLITQNVWENITFQQETIDILQGIQHSHITDSYIFNITEDGLYDISFNLDVIDTSVGASDIDIAARLIYSNGIEINGSIFETDIFKNNIETELSHRFLAKFNDGDRVIFQFVASDVDVEISTHGTFGDKPESVSVIFNKIANL